MGGKKSFAPVHWLIRVSHISLVKVTLAGLCQGSLATGRVILGQRGATVMFLKNGVS